MDNNLPKSLFSANITKKQTSDSGMAFVLVLLIIGFFSHNTFFYIIAIPALIINMTFPKFYYVFAIIWLGFSHLLGTIVSNILLFLIYSVLVIPFGLFRRALGKDNLYLSQFKKGKDSVMLTRNYFFSSKDIEKPY